MNGDGRNSTTAGERPAGSSGRALVVHPYLKSGAPTARAPADHLEEALGLARAIGLDVGHGETVALSVARPATLLGAGKIEELRGIVADIGADVVLIDGALGPKQQQNLEKAWNCKVIDRTGLILEIFGARARTAEGRLQVRLAQLNYERGRLVRTWTHLERQRGGLGAVGGPGESQLESDRRMLDRQIVRLERRLGDVKRTRALHRKRRRQAPWPVVALVGYTNAGKSTLFNRLSGAEIFAEDLLFATLDPAMRAVDLPSGRRIVLSDTVGFVSELPTHLIAAFRATLEEVLEAELVLHVRDIAHNDTVAQKQDVETVLADLELAAVDEGRLVEVLNKIDLLEPAARTRIANGANRRDDQISVSAVTGEGVEDLLVAIDGRLSASRELIEIALDSSDGSGLAWLYRNGEVVSREDLDGRVLLKVGLDAAELGRWRQRGE